MPEESEELVKPVNAELLSRAANTISDILEGNSVKNLPIKTRNSAFVKNP